MNCAPSHATGPPSMKVCVMVASNMVAIIGHGIGFEEVSSHACAVADVVANVVSDDCGVPRDHPPGYLLPPYPRDQRPHRRPS